MSVEEEYFIELRKRESWRRGDEDPETHSSENTPLLIIKVVFFPIEIKHTVYVNQSPFLSDSILIKL